jgi:hypothetical protein
MGSLMNRTEEEALFVEITKEQTIVPKDSDVVYKLFTIKTMATYQE